VEEPSAGLLQGHPALDRVLVSPRRQLAKGLGWGGLKTWLEGLRAVEYDVVLDLQGLMKSAIFVGLSRGRRKIGFAGGKEFDLPGVKVKIATPFCSLIFTALDDQPLADSKHILITAMARDQQSNTKYSEDGTQLLAIGGPPLLMEPVQVTITLKGKPPAEVNVVDVYGVPTDRKVKLDGASFNIDGTYKTYYYEVKR
jgi:hypothetical protein